MLMNDIMKLLLIVALDRKIDRKYIFYVIFIGTFLVPKRNCII